MYVSISTTVTVISQPDDVTICEEEGAVFTCVLNSNIRSDDVQWYRFIKDTSTTVMVDLNGGNINFLTHTNESTTSSSLTITNAIESYTGYFWVGTPSFNVCNTSLTVGTSMFDMHSMLILHKSNFRMYVYNRKVWQRSWPKEKVCESFMIQIL